MTAMTNKTPWTVLTHTEDPEGRYLTVRGYIRKDLYILDRVCIPHDN